jgi:hypothetical protein
MREYCLECVSLAEGLLTENPSEKITTSGREERSNTVRSGGEYGGKLLNAMNIRVKIVETAKNISNRIRMFIISSRFGISTINRMHTRWTMSSLFVGAVIETLRQEISKFHTEQRKGNAIVSREDSSICVVPWCSGQS